MIAWSFAPGVAPPPPQPLDAEPIHETIRRAAEAMARAEHARIELAAIEAHELGDRGVLVVRDRGFRLVRAEPNRFVPAGQMCVINEDALDLATHSAEVLSLNHDRTETPCGSDS